MAGYEEWLWAFFELSNDRQIGMAAGPIPSSSILNWCEGWDYDEMAAFRTCIRAMDAVYLDQSRTDKPKVPEKRMGPEMFDAMFG